ncbi:DNA modification methylase [Leucobacter denitrificans]|uniref:DNA modification methylase n=1 Tax=Leucobacter denitrificans TaxID=683042 RepID=A0A7G9S3U4_9MICO|nr:DNA modification methylase [Leucobacter denitrificans]QNN62519.1 DNA modification methylase [Leucobacter denitrificans]
MKNRIAASIALAAGLALGASGCSLIAHNGTNVQYAPSDGVEISAEGVALRNIILVADQSGENFNVVFTAVNNTEAPASVSITFETDSESSLVEFVAPVGTTSFGNLEEGQEVLVATLSNLQAGQTVEAFFTINGEGDLHEYVPVLDGTLVEYQQYVLDQSMFEVEAVEDVELETEADAEAEAGAEAEADAEATTETE